MKYYDFFSPYIPELKSNVAQQKVKCPFKDHQDAVGSCSINLDKGYYNCFGCKRSGDIYTWVMEWEHCNFKEAKRKILGDARLPVLSEAEVIEAHAVILKKPNVLKAITYSRGWTLDTIKEFQLGWEEKTQKVFIPIRNENNELVNIRKYDIFHKYPKFKMIGIKGHNSPYFFPIKNLIRTDVDFVVLMAGEPDTILACQYDIIAGTFTGGEGTFDRNLLPLFKKKKVYICYDRDLAGVRAEETIAEELFNYTPEIRFIKLPFEVKG